MSYRGEEGNLHLTARPTPEERLRAGRVVRERMERLGLNVARTAQLAQVGETTLRRLLSGSHWPHLAVRSGIEDALRWPQGEIARQARGELNPLTVYTNAELITELLRRERSLIVGHPGGAR